MAQGYPRVSVVQLVAVKLVELCVPAALLASLVCTFCYCLAQGSSLLFFVQLFAVKVVSDFKRAASTRQKRSQLAAKIWRLADAATMWQRNNKESHGRQDSFDCLVLPRERLARTFCVAAFSLVPCTFLTSPVWALLCIVAE